MNRGKWAKSIFGNILPKFCELYAICSSYTGSVSKSYKILPKKTKIASGKPAKKAIALKWNRLVGDASGYEIQYSLGNKFSPQTTKTVVVKNHLTIA